MLIRRMTESDLTQVAAIEQRTFTLPWSETGFRESLALDCTLFLVAEDQEEILGYIGMYFSMDEGEITNVAVDEPGRGRGIGGQLVQKALEEAENSGAARIVLEVRVSNHTAIHVYQKAGFELVGIRKGFYDMPREDAYIGVWTAPDTM